MSAATARSRTEEISDALAHLHAVDPVLAALIDKRPDYDPDAWRRELPKMDLFGCLVFQVAGQQISVTAARAILGRLTAMFDGRLPTPAQAAVLDARSLREIGFSWKKALTLIDLATRFADGRLSQQRLGALVDEEIIAELTQINGIGPWTVHGALIITLRRADVVPIGDIVLRNAMKVAYDLDHIPTEQEAAEIAAPWRPHASLGTNLLFASAELDRQPPVSHRRG